MSDPRRSERGQAPDGGPNPLERIEGRWILRILVCLNAGEHRFADLRSAIPQVSANILADRLRALESAGFVERRYRPPPQASRVYGMTGLSAGLRPVLDALADWSASQRHSPLSHRRDRSTLAEEENSQ